MDLSANYIFILQFYSDKPNSKWKLTISAQYLALITIVNA